MPAPRRYPYPKPFRDRGLDDASKHARAIGVSPSLISKILLGQRNATARVIAKTSEVTGLSPGVVELLFRGEDVDVEGTP